MDRDAVHLLDIVDSARKITTYIEGVTRDDFLQDTRLQDSIVRRLEIIGEAAGRVSTEFRQKHPNIPWGAIRGMRNRMIHRYDDIDMDIVWETVQRDVPRLIVAVNAVTPPAPARRSR